MSLRGCTLEGTYCFSSEHAIATHVNIQSATVHKKVVVSYSKIRYGVMG